MALPISFYIHLCFISVVGAIGIIRYSHLTTPLKYIDWYVVYWVISTWIEYILASYNIHNLWIFHFTTFIGLLLVLTAFYYWQISEWYGKLLKWSFYAYSIVWIVGIFTFEPLTISDDYSGSIAQLIQLGSSIWLLLVVLNDDNVIWKNDPRIWVASGILLYNVSTLLLFGLFNILSVQSPSILKIIWHVNWYATIFVFSLFLRSFFCKSVPGAAGNLQNDKSG